MNDVLQEKDSSIHKALEYMRCNRPLRAEEVCRDYLDQHPGCADHLRLLGHALMKQNRLQEAEEQLRFGLQLNMNFKSNDQVILTGRGSNTGLLRCQSVTR